jgi:hypothetical protein
VCRDREIKIPDFFAEELRRCAAASRRNDDGVTRMIQLAGFGRRLS